MLEEKPLASLEAWQRYEESSVKLDLDAIYARRIEVLIDALARCSEGELRFLQGELQGVRWAQMIPKVRISDLQEEEAKNA